MASDDDALDKKYEDMILERLDNGDVWAWAQVEVQATLPDRRTVSPHLGGCCYEDANNFKEGGYYEDMIAEALINAERLDAPCIDADRKLMEDLLSFVLFTYRRTDMDDTRKLRSLVDTLAHDLNGTLDGDKFFSPRVSGYSKEFPLI
jgi:hypothetical protein